MRSPTDRAASSRPVVRQPILGVRQPPSDSDVLGPEIPADGLTVAVSVGSSLFDDRFGLAGRRPVSDTRRRPPCATPRDRCEFLPELRDHVLQGR